MLSESLIASILASDGGSSNGSSIKDAAIFGFNIQSNVSQGVVYKKSSTQPNGLGLSESHVFAAQSDKAVIHVYSRDKGNQETTVPFTEKVTALVLGGETGENLVLGTESGRVLVWETCTGRLTATAACHLQAITALTVDPASQFVMSGSADSNVLVWSLAEVLSLQSRHVQPLHTLSAHRGSITGLSTGHSHASSNIVVSTSEDRTAMVWNYSQGIHLRTYLLADIPRAIAMDGADRAFYTAYDDGSVQMFEFHQAYDSDGQGSTAPIQADAESRWHLPPSAAAAADSEKKLQTDFGAVLTLALSWDSTRLFSGHESGKIGIWEVGKGQFHGELSSLPGPVTNLITVPVTGFPEHEDQKFKVTTVVKPKMDLNTEDGDFDKYSFTAEFSNDREASPTREDHLKATRDKFEGLVLDSTGFSEISLWDSVGQLAGWSQSQHSRTNSRSDDKSAANGSSKPSGSRDDEEFIPLEDSGPKDRALTMEEEYEQLKKQLDSLKRTQRESFRMLTQVRRERNALLEEIKDREEEEEGQDDEEEKDGEDDE